MDEDPRIQIYRTSLDAFLSWLSLVASALDRKLFLPADIQDVGYWVAKILTFPLPGWKMNLALSPPVERAESADRIQRQSG